MENVSQEEICWFVISMPTVVFKLYFWSAAVAATIEKSEFRVCELFFRLPRMWNGVCVCGEHASLVTTTDRNKIQLQSDLCLRLKNKSIFSMENPCLQPVYFAVPSAIPSFRIAGNAKCSTRILNWKFVEFIFLERHKPQTDLFLYHFESDSMGICMNNELTQPSKTSM